MAVIYRTAVVEGSCREWSLRSLFGLADTFWEKEMHRSVFFGFAASYSSAPPFDVPETHGFSAHRTAEPKSKNCARFKSELSAQPMEPLKIEIYSGITAWINGGIANVSSPILYARVIFS